MTAATRSLNDAVLEVLAQLPEERVRQVLDFAEYLRYRDGTDETWHAQALASFAAGYGPDEPEYTLADVKPDESA